MSTPSATADVTPAVVARATEDGRRARRDRNRDAVVDAMLELYIEGNYVPSSDEIAVRAGLSPRSLFRYFDDLDDLVRAAISRQHSRVRPAIDIDIAGDAPLADRVAALIRQRLGLFDAISSVGVVSRLREPFQPLIAAELMRGRRFLRHQIERLFATELTAAGAQRGARMLAATDVLCSFESWQLLRNDQQLSRDDAAATLNDGVMAVMQVTRKGEPQR